MHPQCADWGVGTIIWSPLARSWGETTARSASAPIAEVLYAATAKADHANVQALDEIAQARGIGMAQVTLAWLRRNPVVTAPIVGATKPHHIDDAVAALALELSDEEVRRLEAPYTPRYDFQGVSDPKVLQQISERIGIKTAS